MARVRKCDRCGEVYHWYGGVNTVGITSFNMDNESILDEEYNDLCPKCSKELIIWLNMHKEKHKQRMIKPPTDTTAFDDDCWNEFPED